VHYVRLDSTWFDMEKYPLPSEPVLLADETQTIQWFSEKPKKGETIEHKEHERDDQGQPIFEGKDGSQKPKMKSRKITAKFWAPIQVSD